jgi:hypothetical protein
MSSTCECNRTPHVRAGLCTMKHIDKRFQALTFFFGIALAVLEKPKLKRLHTLPLHQLSDQPARYHIIAISSRRKT